MADRRRHRNGPREKAVGRPAVGQPVNLAIPDVSPAEIDAASVGLSGVVGPLGLVLGFAIAIGAIVRRIGRRSAR